MSEYIKICKFMQALFEEETTANRAAEIGQAMLAVRSLRLTDLAAKMKGCHAASYKRIQRFDTIWISHLFVQNHRGPCRVTQLEPLSSL